MIFDKDNLPTLDFSRYKEGARLKNYLSNLVMQGPTPYFKNVRAKVILIVIDDTLIPATVNETEFDNSYVCSPFTHYVSGGLERLPPMGQFAAKPLEGLIKGAGFNRVVQVNNWLFSTNLFDPLTQDQIAKITKTVKQAYPSHAILFRSLTKREPVQALLERENYHLIAARPIFFLDTTKEEPFKARMFKSDLKLFKESPYSIVEGNTLTDAELETCISLYSALYLEKYSRHNPQITKAFLKEAIACNLLRVKAFKLEGQVEAVLGYTVKNGVATSPLFGYDPSLAEKTGLYRQLATLLVLEAKEQNLLLNQSAGATSFKTLRRGEKELESIGVFVDHLSYLRQLPWKALKLALNSAGAKFMLKANI